MAKKRPEAALMARSAEKKHEDSVKAGNASANARKARKAFKNTLECILELDATPRGKQYLKRLGIDDMTNQALISAKLIDQATKGNISAFKEVRDTVGEKPTDKTINVEESYDQYIESIEDNEEY